MRDDRQDRQIALDDLKKRLIDLTENKPELPGVAWDAEPVRYFKLNQEWCKLLAGWLDWMESEAFWPDATGQDYPGIQGILKFEEGIELPVTDFDCGDVEDCLENSDIIAALNAQIDDLNNQIDNLEEELEEVDNATGGGTTLPPNPTHEEAANATCKAANYIADRLIENMLQMWADAQELTLQEWMQSILSVVSFDFPAASDFWQKAVTIGNETLADDAAVFKPNLVTALFCAELDYELTLEALQDDSEIPTDEKALLITTLDNYKQAKLNEWASIGTLGTTDYDCSEGCPRVTVWDFGGNYVPVGDEDLIIPGDSWSVEHGSFVGGLGYIGAETGVLQITKSLPEQCRIVRYEVSVAKAVNCGRSDIAFWYRGVDGVSAEQWSPEQFTGSNLFVPIGFNPNEEPLMSQAKVANQAVACVPGDDFPKIGYVRLVTTGAKPS